MGRRWQRCFRANLLAQAGWPPTTRDVGRIFFEVAGKQRCDRHDQSPHQGFGQGADTEEKNSQAAYETMMKESTSKRTADSKALSNKVSTLADTEAELMSLKEDKKASGSELMALTRYIASLHSECDWLLQYHEVRKEARSGEIDSLNRAKAVLSGADFAMLQTRTKGFLRH